VDWTRLAKDQARRLTLMSEILKRRIVTLGEEICLCLAMKLTTVVGSRPILELVIHIKNHQNKILKQCLFILQKYVIQMT